MSSCRRREPASAPLTAPILTVSFFADICKPSSEQEPLRSDVHGFLGVGAFVGAGRWATCRHMTSISLQHLVVGAWIRMVMRTAMNVTEATI